MVQKMQRNCFTLLLTFSATGYLMSVKNSYNWTLSSEDVFNNIESSSSTCWISALSFKLVKNCSVLGRWVLCWQPPSTDWSGGWGRGGERGFVLIIVKVSHCATEGHTARPETCLSSIINYLFCLFWQENNLLVVVGGQNTVYVNKRKYPH